ncbi:MAG: helix-turn-helix transcriptional regulator [Byssovorax sp.]
MSRRSLSPEQNERVVGYVRELLKRYHGNQSELAPRLGVTQPTISGIVGGRQTTSYQVALRVAELLGLDEREVLHGIKPAAPVALKSNPRQAAAVLAREDGVYEGAIESVLAEEDSPATVDRSTLWWAMRMKLREHELVEGSSSVKKRKPRAKRADSR